MSTAAPSTAPNPKLLSWIPHLDAGVRAAVVY